LIAKNFAEGMELVRTGRQIGRSVSVFLREESGQDLVEYALVAGLIGLGAVVAMTGLSTKVKQAFNTVGNNLSNAI
jgi:pilus assembly protein Flp/PilA